MKPFKAIEHLTIQVAISIYGDQVKERTVRDVLAVTGRQLAGTINTVVQTDLTLELNGEPNVDWEISNIIVGASEYFHNIQRDLIRSGRVDGLKYAINYLKLTQEGSFLAPDLTYIIDRLTDELKRQEQHD